MNYAIIPARGGSKGVPKKNIRMICGMPLIFWSIAAAKNSKSIDKILVSTDDLEIAEISRSYGVDVDIRPAKLAEDTSTTLEVVRDLVGKYADMTTLIILQPTSPLRDFNLIDECVSEFNLSNCTNLATGYLCKSIEFGSHNNKRRQDIDGFFYDDGNIYILKREIVQNGHWSGKKIYKKIIARYQNFEIDDEVDFVILEALMKNYMKLEELNEKI